MDVARIGAAELLIIVVGCGSVAALVILAGVVIAANRRKRQ